MRAPYDKITRNTVFDLPGCVNQARAGLELVDISSSLIGNIVALKSVPRKPAGEAGFQHPDGNHVFHDQRGASAGLAGIASQQGYRPHGSVVGPFIVVSRKSPICWSRRKRRGGIDVRLSFPNPA
jgi:hypothetical protein